MKRRERRQWQVFPWAAPRPEHHQHVLPLVSVVLPVYNQSGFLAESVESVLAETSIPLELVLIDDGSTEDIRSVLDRFTEDPRFRCIRQANSGLARALDAGFAAAKGGLLTWTSADNRYLPGALRGLAAFLAANPGLDLVYANVRLIDEEGGPFVGSVYRASDQREPGAAVLDLPYAAETLHQFNDNFLNACFMFRRSLALRCGPHRAAARGFEDYELWLRGSVGGRYAHVDTDDPWYEYRLHDETLTAELWGRLRGRQAPVVAECRRRRELLASEELRFTCRRPREVTASRAAAIAWLAELVRAEERAPVRGPLPEVVCYLVRGGRQHEIATMTVDAVPDDATARSPSCPFLRRIRGGGPDRAVRLSSGSEDSPRSQLIFPPLPLPAILRRARDTNFNAVTPHVPDAHAVLVLLPEGGAIRESAAPVEPLKAAEEISEIVRANPALTFVLLASEPDERHVADSIHLHLVGAANLRIIDLSDRAPDTSFEEALLYVFGSVDALLYRSGGSMSAAEVEEVRTAALLAALAGLPLIYAVDGGALLRHTMTELSLSGARPDAANDLLSALLPMPHLRLLDRSRGAAQAVIEPLLLEAPDYRSLEQLIDGASAHAARERVRSFALSGPLDETVVPTSVQGFSTASGENAGASSRRTVPEVFSE